jgi:hypothetical protein
MDVSKSKVSEMSKILRVRRLCEKPNSPTNINNINKPKPFCLTVAIYKHNKRNLKEK